MCPPGSSQPGGGRVAPVALEATRLLRRLDTASPSDAARLLELVYGELRQLAAGYLQRERTGHTLQPTALVHEAYLRLIDQSQVEWQGRNHFLGIAAQAMRRILVDHARARARVKRGGGRARFELDSAVGAAPDDELDLVAVDAALERLRDVSDRAARVVEMRFFAGLPAESAAESLGISLSTAEREWRFAKAWLARELKQAPP
ncbi:MAG TPA: sigma-70 family RNA polymerase sigma factor [Planctomycetota bacterium]|nr:sigma-70 family RNA polymerase sigma factor [Planctomycetota bacterium]